MLPQQLQGLLAALAYGTVRCNKLLITNLKPLITKTSTPHNKTLNPYQQNLTPVTTTPARLHVRSVTITLFNKAVFAYYKCVRLTCDL